MRLRFTWWQVMWLILFLSGLTFRARTAAEISESPVDGWALYRMACVGLVALILFLRLTLRKTNWPHFLFSGVIGVLALYPLFSLVSTIWSVNLPWTFYKSVEYLIDLGALAAIVGTLHSAEEYRRFVDWTWVLLGALVVSAWIGACVDPSDALFFDPNLRITALPMRLLGLVPVVSYNDLSEISATLALVALCRIMADEGAQQHITRYWVLFFTAAVTLVITQTRGSFIAFLVGLVLLLVFTRRYVLIIVGGATSFLLTVPLLLFTHFGNSMQTFFLRGQNVEGATGMSGRVEVWQESLQKVADHPWIGYGGFAGARFVVISKSSDASNTLSCYIDSLLNIGLVGLSILVVVLVIVGYCLYKYVRDSDLSRFENYLAFEMLIAFVVLAVRSIESGNLITHPMLSFLVIVGAVQFLRGRRKFHVLSSLETASA